MKIIRFILPFLFVRNWYDGSWELSRLRLALFLGLVLLLLLGIGVIYVLQAPEVYTSYTV